MTFSLVRAEAGRSENQQQILENINKFLLKMDAKMFVTLLYCTLDYKTGTLQYSRAGHIPPIVLDQGGKFLKISLARGQPLGVIENLSIDHKEFIIPERGVAILFSDGLHEAIDSQQNEFGFDRVKDELLAHRHESAEDICERLWLAVKNHSGALPHQDDFTIVVVKRC
jgi:sigma-B regulation protein RsbU (phosphoserine phosphatase)